METNLHKQKIQILGRLIKESSLTLEEALLLLQAEEETVVETTVSQPIQFNPGTGHFPSGTGFLNGSGTVTIRSPWNTGTTTTNLNYPNITSTYTSSLVADLEKAIEDASI